MYFTDQKFNTLSEIAIYHEEQPGPKTIKYDNVDVVIKVSDMTEENQNVESHNCLKAYVMNRVGGNDLSTDSPRRKLNDVPNGEFLFDKDDHKKQRSDVINNETYLGTLAVVGDQLSVERAINSQFQSANGFTPEERLDGMHFEIADFHTEMKFMQLCFNNFFLTDTSDKCTLGSDKVLINRRNVQSDTSDEQTENGRFKCRFPGCKQTYQHNGKFKRDHELKRHGLEPIESKCTKSKISDNKTDDDMFNYQCNVMEFMMLIRNFKDAISEGDGDRTIRTWKFMLPYLKDDEAGSRKYAVEGFHLLCLVTCLLSEQDAYRLI
ncbi:uncharacterized protein [Clytia hemisphaerica]|uniref:uncharacterized protein n=1 Tax=Clytia hemisphaerica TaxID=252671 RepID=UPI0034D5D672